MKTIILQLFFISIIFAQAPSFEYTEQDTFFNKRIDELRIEYLDCTGDSTTLDAQQLLDWKNRIHLQSENPDYRNILKEYMTMTGIVENIRPCHVLEWNLDRIRFLKKSEASLQNKLATESDYVVDSINYLLEQRRNPRSPFDFDSIPFGFSKKAFLRTVEKKGTFPISIQKNGTFLIEHYTMRDFAYLVEFMFDPNDRLTEYRIMTYPCTGNAMNTSMHPAAQILLNRIETNVGPVSRLNRIGYFDIKPNTPLLYAHWDSKTHDANIFFWQKESKFFAELRIKVIPVE